MSIKQTARQTALFAIIGLFAGLAGFLIAAGNGITLDGHDHGADHGHMSHGSKAMDHEGHTSHGTMDSSHAVMHDMPHLLDTNNPAPELMLKLHADRFSGFNLHLSLKNFVLTGRNASGDHIDGEGHAHLYIDGVKQGRIYGEWTHIAAISDTAQTLSVSLNGNDHRPLSYNGNLIEASLSLADIRDN